MTQHSDTSSLQSACVNVADLSHGQCLTSHSTLPSRGNKGICVVWSCSVHVEEPADWARLSKRSLSLPSPYNSFQKPAQVPLRPRCSGWHIREGGKKRDRHLSMENVFALPHRFIEDCFSVPHIQSQFFLKPSDIMRLILSRPSLLSHLFVLSPFN